MVVCRKTVLSELVMALLTKTNQMKTFISVLVEVFFIKFRVKTIVRCGKNLANIFDILAYIYIYIYIFLFWMIHDDNVGARFRYVETIKLP